MITRLPNEFFPENWVYIYLMGVAGRQAVEECRCSINNRAAGHRLTWQEEESDGKRSSYL
jgi:hypothetical protein